MTFKMEKWITNGEQETIDLGARFAKTKLKLGDVVALIGELGSGKTRFIKGICSGLGVREHVSSPSFTIVNEYASDIGKIFHFDFYRIASPSELSEIGFDDYIYADGICLIEWADRVKDLLPSNRYDVLFTLGDSDTVREIVINNVNEEIK
jgi:tRNA threonylcarbamoyladenosine biosynthesis protein TsaE